MRVHKKSVIFFALIWISVASGLILFFPKYWHMEPPQISGNVSMGVTESGHPWIGSEQPALTISEFADYQCYQCRKMHYFLRQLISKHPDRLRLVHRHFPMDHEVNPIVKKPLYVGSGRLALMAIYAQEQGRFWELSDQLFSLDKNKGTISYTELAQKSGLDVQGLANSVQDPRMHQKLWSDIKEGIDMGMTGTPGYVIDGKLYSGTIPPDILKKIIR